MSVFVALLCEYMCTVYTECPYAYVHQYQGCLSGVSRADLGGFQETKENFIYIEHFIPAEIHSTDQQVRSDTIYIKLLQEN